MPTTATYTALQLCTAALQKCGVVAIDRGAASEEIDTALITLNIMLKAAQMPATTRWKEVTGSITITDATQSYAISSRPLDLDVVNLRSSDGRDTPMTRMTREGYLTLPDKASAGTATTFYYHREREQGTLYVWPVIATAASETIEWSGRAEIEDITATTDAVDVPAEWYEAVVYGLALRLCDDFAVDPGRRAGIAQMAAGARREAEDADRPEVVYLRGGAGRR